MHKMPVFAPFRTGTISSSLQDQMAQEVHECLPYATPDLITYENNVSVHDNKFATLSRHLNLLNAEVCHQNQEGTLVKGSKNSFSSVNLRSVAHNNLTKTEQFIREDGVRKSLVFKYKNEWKWREDIQTPRLREFIENLSIDRLTLVRIIFLDPPAVGGVHVDTLKSSMKEYYEAGGISLTLNLIPGDTTLSFLVNDKVHSIPAYIQGWHFDPSVPHAVGVANEFRAQVRIFGYHKDILNWKAIDWDQAIYE